MLVKKTTMNPNTEAIKFLAACLVIVCHAYPLNGGPDVMDGLYVLTRGQINWGSVAVSIFFTFSGYYLAKSVCKYQMGRDYFRERAKRIFPALWIVVLLSVFLVGPLFTTLSLGDYFKSGDTWRYFGNAVLIPVHDLPGVFTDHIHLPAVNGSLWTLSVEMLCYTALWILYKMNLLQKKKIFLSIPLFGFAVGAIILAGSYLPVLLSMLGPALSFYIAIYLQLYGDEIYHKIKSWIRWGSYAVLVVVSLAMGIASVVMRIFVPLITIELIRNVSCFPSWLGR